MAATSAIPSIVRPLGPGPLVFRLTIGGIGELEQLTGSGIMAVFMRLSTMQARLADVRETIRLGLIGGGRSPPEALALVTGYVDPFALGESLELAHDILNAYASGLDSGSAPKNPQGDQSASPAT